MKLKVIILFLFLIDILIKDIIIKSMLRIFYKRTKVQQIYNNHYITIQQIVALIIMRQNSQHSLIKGQ